MPCPFVVVIRWLANKCGNDAIFFSWDEGHKKRTKTRIGNVAWEELTNDGGLSYDKIIDEAFEIFEEEQGFENGEIWDSEDKWEGRLTPRENEKVGKILTSNIGMKQYQQIQNMKTSKIDKSIEKCKIKE